MFSWSVPFLFSSLSMQKHNCAFVFVCLQMDLEPEGKVYVHITLTGSFTDGKSAPVDWNIAQCFSSCLNIALALLPLCFFFTQSWTTALTLYANSSFLVCETLLWIIIICEHPCKNRLSGNRCARMFLCDMSRLVCSRYAFSRRQRTSTLRTSAAEICIWSFKHWDEAI